MPADLVPFNQTCYVVNAIYMPAGPMPLHDYVAAASTIMFSSLASIITAVVQTRLLVESCVRWVFAGPLLLNQYACRSITTQSCMLPHDTTGLSVVCYCGIS